MPSGLDESCDSRKPDDSDDDQQADTKAKATADTPMDLSGGRPRQHATDGLGQVRGH